MWQSVGLTFLVFVATLICVLLFMLCGWYVVWHLFLSKFKFLRELVCDSGSLQGDSESSSSSSSSSVSESEPSSTPQRTRPKTARQRKIPADEAT
ncbi:small integral membrane protein 13 [Ranitomeya imitator]|uniref:small integral membrane protein 13 n=1 Tax=Ranitomeya imitator TaxID=111125 RepID=UPI001AAACA8C